MRVIGKIGKNEIILEIDDSSSPNTAKEFLKKIPFDVGINVWGEELYTDKTPLTQKEENSVSVVSLNDVAYWPPGNAICLFFGPTPLGTPDQIKPYSPVNVIGKIINPDKKIISSVKQGQKISFRLG